MSPRCCYYHDVMPQSRKYRTALVYYQKTVFDVLVGLKLKLVSELLLFFIQGRFEDDFVAERMRQLQLWIDRLCRHPVVHHSNVLHHFLTCTDDKVGIIANLCLVFF